MATHAQEPWWKEPTRGQWFAFGAAWFGWVLDAFDFSIFILAMPRIGKDLGTTVIGTTASLALTLLARLAGGVLAGAAADKWGRKLPLMLSIIWFAICDGAVAFAPTFGWVLVLRTLFGFGMGAEWASGTALAMESWPERSRGIASGVLQGSWAIGFFLASWVYGLVMPTWGWRALFIVAAVPALLVLPIRIWVPESDAWERAHGELKAATRAVTEKVPFKTIAWGCAAMALGFGAYYALVGVHTTVLITELNISDVGVSRIGMLCQLGMLIGAVLFGAVAGRRGAALAIALPALVALPILPLYVGTVPSLLGVGAFATGMFGMGFCGVTPLLLTNLFPAVSRAKNIGLVYHVGSSFAAFVPMGIAAISRASGMTLGHTLAVVAAVFLIGLTALILFGIERKPVVEVALTSILLVALLAWPREARAADAIEPVPSFGTNAAGLKMYRYAPASTPKNAPLVVALHGCTQTANDYTKVGWNELADKYGFYVAYAEKPLGGCFDWYSAASTKRGQGDNESIKEMVDNMKASYSIDAKRVFVTGLSAGGAETAIMLAAWPDVFAAGAPIAGLPYECGITCMSQGTDQPGSTWADKVRSADPGFSGPWPRVSVWQGTSDAVVNPTNEKEIAKQFASVHGAADAPSGTNKVTSATHSTWTDGSGQVVVEMYAVDGMGHGVPVDPASGCGTTGTYVLDAKICSTEKIADFFGLTGAVSGTSSSSGGGPGTPGGPGASSGTQGSAAGAPQASGCACRSAGLDSSDAVWAPIALALLVVRRRSR